MSKHRKQTMYEKKNLIMIHGGSQFGKNVVGDYIQTEYGYVTFAFGDEIKRILSNFLGESIEYFEEHKDEIVDWLGVTRRKLMVTLGTDWGRNMINPRIWIMKTQETIKNSMNHSIGKNTQPFNAVITDLRFLNEAKEFIENTDFNVKILKIISDRKKKFAVHENIDNHSSEQANIPNNYIDDVIVNNSEVSLSELHSHVEQFMKKYLGE